MMQSCIKILHFWLNGGPCLTKTKQSDQLDEYQQVQMVKMAKFIKTWKEKLKLIKYALFPVFDRIMYSYFAANILESTQGFKTHTSFVMLFPLNILFPWRLCFSSPHYLMKQ